MEQGLTADVRTSRLIVVADTVTIGHAETRLRRRSDVLLVDGMQHASEDGEEMGGMSTSEEWELGRTRDISNA